MVMLDRKFSAPKRRDSEQWAKVKLLVEHGFYFFSVYQVGENGKKVPVPYPNRLSEVPHFVAEFREQSALFGRARLEQGRSLSASAGDA
jgi:hypothetical protein